MEENSSDSGSNGAVGWWAPELLEKIESVSLREENLNNNNSNNNTNNNNNNNNNIKESVSLSSSQILWSTGTFTGRIPNGFYSLIPDRKLKEVFQRIPSLEELQSLGMDGLKADVILVDTERDRKLSMLKQLCAALVKGLTSNPALIIKKIASLVFDFYKRPNHELSSPRIGNEEGSHFTENRGVQLLGQIRHGSCRPRAILFKFLADSIGLESKIVVGLPNEGPVEFSDAYKHMSVLVVLNSMELLVDLMRFPGQLIPFSAKSIFASHISVAGESDSAENDSCDSPLEPNSPLCGFNDKVDPDSSEQDENLHQKRTELSSSNLSGRSLRSVMLRSRTFTEGKLSSSHSEPNILNALWRHNQRKAITGEEHIANSSPEHPLSKVTGRSSLGVDGAITPRSDGSSNGPTTPGNRRLRRRSISITPEIGDDIVRAVRAMNETLKQNRLQRDHVVENSCYSNENSPNSLANQESSQKAVSLPSSPHEIMRGQSSKNDDFIENERLVSNWNRVLGGSTFLNKPLLLFDEWNIDFSELTIGTRVGIGFFGEVFRGIWNGTDVAIKVFLEQDLTTENMEDFCNEIFILSRLRHPNVILFLGACMRPPHLSMVTEYMEMGSLYYLIHMTGQKKRLTWRKRLRMLRDICRGLMCIHRMKIIHRDIKSANCLVNRHWIVKICDFGLSRVVPSAGGPVRDGCSSAGTPEWMAPELMRNEEFSEKCDIFSLGVVMWELCMLRRPWEGVPPVQVVYAVANEGSRLEIPEGPLGKLIADCWAEPPHERPSCEEILTRLIDCEYALT